MGEGDAQIPVTAFLLSCGVELALVYCGSVKQTTILGLLPSKNPNLAWLFVLIFVQNYHLGWALQQEKYIIEPRKGEL